MVVPRTGGYYGRLFKTEQGINQGYPVDPIILNIVVDTVLQVTLMEVCDPQESQHGIGWAVGEHRIVFYAKYGRIAGRNSIWV